MPSSTSSFERPVPDLPWLLILGTALLGFLAFSTFMEIRLAQLGYQPTTLDSKERWATERSRASELGKKALTLIGASRIQLGVDIDTLRKESGLEPVQLAVDGSSFIPILKNLADDPSVRGTVLVDYSPHVLEGALSGNQGAAEPFLKAYETQKNNQAMFTIAHVEKYLSEHIRDNLRSYADGASPLMSLQLRIIPNRKARNYLTTLPDRSRLADYTLVAMPEFYYRRVARNLGGQSPVNLTAPNAGQILEHRIEALKPHGNAAYLQGAGYVKQLARQIESRGGRVIFVAMPTSGMIREIDDKRYPRAAFLDLLEKEAGIAVLNSADDPALKSFACPDGSHLDFRDRARFTAALARSAGLASGADRP